MNMERKHLSFLIGSLAVVCSFCSCGSAENKDDATVQHVKAYLKENYNVKLTPNIKRVFVLNDLGCGNCVRALSEFVKDNVDDENSLVVVQSRGANVDIEEFMKREKGRHNVVVSHRANDDDSIFSKLGVIYLTDSKADTIINISADKASSQISYVAKRRL
jgi:hypothetical protein